MRIIDPRSRLRDLADSRRLSLAAVSRMLDRPDRYLSDFVRLGRPAALEDRDRRALAQFFGVSEVELGGDDARWIERRARRAA